MAYILIIQCKRRLSFTNLENKAFKHISHLKLVSIDYVNNWNEHFKTVSS